MTRPEIYLATPAYGGLVTTNYMLSVLDLTRSADGLGFEVSVNLLAKDSLVTRSRNTLVAHFLRESAASHMMFVDADIGFRPEQVKRMLDFDEDVVAGMYPLKALRWEQPATLRHPEDPRTSLLHYVGQFAQGDRLATRDGFVTAVYCGTGFMLMKRTVLERMVAAYPETAYRRDHVHAADGSTVGDAHALFECVIDRDTGEYLSEDFGFCRRWLAIDGTIWLDTLGSLSHTGPIDFVGDPASRFWPKKS
ncbi:MAG: hypothetical protein LWW93_07580 [Hyphomicrobiales bacterium]|nr:hypothetical protein [Hyphomicrobiales bacterium]